jgi:hypothetical protein
VTDIVARVRGAIGAHRRESVRVGVALAAAMVSIAIGVAARGRVAPVTMQRNRLRATEHDLVTFRAAFQQASLEERAFRFPDSLAVSTSRELRFSVAQRVAQRAEQLGLSDVRIRFAEADSAEPPTVPELSDTHIAVADYSIALDCRGDFAAVLSLVDALPASVALQRLAAERAPGGEPVNYHVVLAVFESSSDSTPAPASDAIQQVAQLLPYATPSRESDLMIVAAPRLAPARDAFVSRSATRLAAAAPIDSAPRLKSPKEPAVAYHVTTTLMAGSRRAALINDRLIYVGERLPDGSKLTSVERDRVVVTDHNGTAHTVAVAREGEG